MSLGWRRAIVVLLIVTTTTLLASCVRGPFFGQTSTVSGDVETDYAGNFENEARACAAIATSGSLRDDSGVPSWIKVTDIGVEQRISGAVPPERPDTSDISYYVGGHTYVSYASSDDDVYKWTCLVTLEEVDGLLKLSAELLSFQHVNP